MLDAFLEFIRSENLLPPDSRVLVAISGGVDSVVLTHLFRQASWPFGLAHCNFKLRAEASEADERFVQHLAQAWEVPFFTRSFDTLQIATAAGISVQMAARELRYDWLETIRQQENYSHIATAHHLNDSIETVLYNFTKGCGIRGLHGIPVRIKHVVRPLLFATRAAIESWATTHSLDFREDASNMEDKYSRNKIRLQVLPALREINPALEDSMASNLQRLNEAEYLYDYALQVLRAEVVKQAEGRLLFSVGQLRKHGPARSTLLFEWLSPFGFNSSQAQQVAQSLEHTGAVFFAPGHRLLVDREYLILESLQEEANAATYQLEEKNQILQLPNGRLSLHHHRGRPAIFSSNTTEAALDATLLEFPLRLRHWQEGDVFQPLGMDGQHQKVQDFFTNNKVPRFDKESAWILEDHQGRICWLVGYRIDDRFRIKADTTAYWALKYEKV